MERINKRSYIDFNDNGFDNEKPVTSKRMKYRNDIHWDLSILKKASERVTIQDNILSIIYNQYSDQEQTSSAEVMNKLKKPIIKNGYVQQRCVSSQAFRNNISTNCDTSCAFRGYQSKLKRTTEKSQFFPVRVSIPTGRPLPPPPGKLRYALVQAKKLN